MVGANAVGAEEPRLSPRVPVTAKWCGGLNRKKAQAKGLRYTDSDPGGRRLPGTDERTASYGRRQDRLPHVAAVASAKRAQVKGLTRSRSPDRLPVLK